MLLPAKIRKKIGLTMHLPDFFRYIFYNFVDLLKIIH